MAKKSKFGRLSQTEIQKRVLELETLYGQKNLANQLGVSVDSIRRYRSGKTQPQTKSLYDKLNRIYNRNRNAIDQGAVEQKRKLIEARSRIQKEGKPKKREVTIENYLNFSPAEQFRNTRNMERLLDLSEAGYVAAYYGGNAIPLEVHFLIHGEPLSRFGKVVNIVGIVTNEVSPKEENKFTGQDSALTIFPTYFRLIHGLKKSDGFSERMDKIRQFFFEEIKVDRGYTVAFMGYFFDEMDET